MKTNKPGLLDVNVLIALVDPQHVFHDAAHAWFEGNQHFGWATCPITENGCLRIMSNPGYAASGLTVDRVREILTGLVHVKGHRFWPDSISMLEAGRFDLSDAGPKHLTDLYLLGLAKSLDGRLVTFDRTIRWQSVAECGPENLDVI